MSKINESRRNIKTEEINSAFKKLAFKYHPDKNRSRIEWATQAMSQINIAYSSVLSYRFKNNEKIPEKNEPKKEPRKEKKEIISIIYQEGKLLRI